MYTEKLQVKSGVFHGIPQEKYFIPCHRKYSGQQNPWAIRPADDEKVNNIIL